MTLSLISTLSTTSDQAQDTIAVPTRAQSPFVAEQADREISNQCQALQHVDGKISNPKND